MKKNALLLFSAVLCLLLSVRTTAQELSPTVIYQIQNESGLMMSYDGDGEFCRLAASNPDDPNQQWYVVPSGEGLVQLMNVSAGKYLGLVTSSWNTWDCHFYDNDELEASLDHAQYTIENIDGEYSGLKIKSSSKYLGLDEADEGSKIWCDKSISNYGKWKFVALASDAQNVYQSAYDNILKYAEENFQSNYTVIYDFISDSLMNVSSIYETGSDEDYETGANVLQDFSRKLSTVKSSLDTMNKTLQRMIELIQMTDFPGIDALNADYETYSDLLLGGNITYKQALEGPDAMEEVVKNYYLSQLPSATPENPADLSYFIKHPSFREELAYTEDCKITSSGWTTQSADLPDTGTDIGAKNKLEDEVGRSTSCFNMWSWQFSTMSVNQELAGLPEGRYILTCEGWTNGGEVVAQHAYATSNSGITVESNYASEAMLSTAWERFTTPEINVSDGYLKIGFISQKEDKGGSKGWFLVTDFKLLYVGELGTSTIVKDIQNRLVVAEEIVLTLNGDKTVLVNAVAQAKAIDENSGQEEAQLALDTLNAAIEEAQKAAKQYKDFIEGSYASATEYASSLADEKAQELMNSVLTRVDNTIAADTTTYKAVSELEALIDVCRSYTALYVERAIEALTLTSLKPEAVANLNTVVSDNWNALQTALSVDEIRALTQKLEIAVDDAMLTQPAGENTEMSFLIKNADAADGGDNYLTAWEVSKGNGNKYTNAGESFTKSPSDRYIDSYNSEAGALKFTAKQTVYNLPNGTYRMKVATRADGENAYIFALSGDKLLKTAIANNNNAGGEIYQEAYDKAYKEAIEAGVPEDEIDETTLDIPYASKGWGWSYIDNIEVTNHELVIGVSTDSEVTLDEPFTGCWFSADKFALYYLAEGDNSDFKYTTPVENISENKIHIAVVDGQIVVNGASDVRIYHINGAAVSAKTVPAGIYVVRADGKSYKVVVK